MIKESDLEAFCTALEAGDSDAARALLLRDPRLAAARLPDGWPVFLLQSVFPKAEILALLVAHGADPNARSPEGETLLHLTGDPEAIAELVALGADPNATDHQGRTPMMGHAPYPETGPEAIRALLAAGADPRPTDHDGRTAAMLLPEGAAHEPLRRALSQDR